jgi:hypothetical protein
MFAKTTKVLVTALVLAGASLTLIGSASAAPNQRGWSQGQGQGQESYMNERHDPTNTNGF